jgi:hypothetical protein
MAKLTDQSNSTSVIFADVFPGQVEAQLKAGANRAQMDIFDGVCNVCSVKVGIFRDYQ